MDYSVEGFKEVVFSVRNLDRDIAFYGTAGGWDLIYRGEVSRALLNLWNLPETCTAEEAILKYPGKEQGQLRLISYQAITQRHIRSSAQSWDTGGIYDIDCRVLDLPSKIEEFQKAGWTAYSDYKEYHFNQYHVSEVLMHGSEDIVFAMIQRHAPPLEGYPMLKQLSQPFNSSQIVRDLDAARQFYLDLGFIEYMTFLGEDGEAGHNLFGVPYNIYPQIKRKISILSPDGTNIGSVELVQLEGLDGRDFAEDAVPPNLGILMLRFPVSNIEIYYKKLQDQGTDIHTQLNEVEIAPYGKCKLFVLKAPDGAWLEFIEPLNT